ncbi:MAG: hypothetical protein ACD_8C00114G0002 [uncultured bacterium]|nr:MAG: hypothetical protein ACD_8C00114G0002 [uncultured bacterium]
MIYAAGLNGLAYEKCEKCAKKSKIRKMCPLRDDGCQFADDIKCTEEWFVVCEERAIVQVGFGTRDYKLAVKKTTIQELAT